MIVAALLLLLSGVQELPGNDTRTVHVVNLMTSKPENCLSVPTGQGLSFVLDVADVRDMAKLRSAQWKTEAERMILVRSEQAQALLAHPSGQKDLLGCEVAEKPGQGIYALLEIVNRGHGRVWEASSNSFLSTIERLEYNLDCSHGPFGTYTFRKPGGEEFMFIQACMV